MNEFNKLVIGFAGAAKSRQISKWAIWALAVIVIIVSGVSYRLLANRLNPDANIPIKLPIPLSAFPAQIGNWVGSELPVPTTTKEYMQEHFADDFFSRRYINSSDNIWADVYIVYCSSRPSGILGHRPGVCYPAHGWQPKDAEKSLFISKTGRQVEYLVQRFRKETSVYDEVVVLSFYIRNGQVVAEEDDFSGVFARKPNIARDPARYVAQIQISSVLESSARRAAQDITELAISFLPDEHGKVRAAESIRSFSTGGKIPK